MTAFTDADETRRPAFGPALRTKKEEPDTGPIPFQDDLRPELPKAETRESWADSAGT